MDDTNDDATPAGRSITAEAQAEPDTPDDGASGSEADTPPGDLAQADVSNRRRILIGVGGLLLGAFATVAGILVLASGGASKDVWAYTNRPPESVKYVDALVRDATKTSFALVERDGTRHNMCIRPADSPYIDVQHAQTHASLGQPVRAYYKPEGSKRCVVYMEDSPQLF